MEERGNDIFGLTKNEVLCTEGEVDSTMYQVVAGRFMVSVRKGTEVIPLAYIERNEFIGELSYFDNLPRSADIIAVETSTIRRIRQDALSELPEWFQIFCKYITKRIRTLDDAVRTSGIKKKNSSLIRPLTIDEQRFFLKLIKDHEEKILNKF